MAVVKGTIRRHPTTLTAEAHQGAASLSVMLHSLLLEPVVLQKPQVITETSHEIEIGAIETVIEIEITHGVAVTATVVVVAPPQIIAPALVPAL